MLFYIDFLYFYCIIQGSFWSYHGGNLVDKLQKQRIFEFALFVGIPLALWSWFIMPMWKPLFFGVVLAILFSGLYRRFKEYLGEGKAAALVVAVAALSTVIPASIALYYLVGVINELVAALQVADSPERQFLSGVIKQILPFIESFIPEREGKSDIEQVIGLLSDNLNSIAEISRTILGALYTGVLGIGFGLVVILFSLFYFLLYGQQLLEYLEDIAPVRKAFVDRAYREFSQMTKVIIKVTAIIGLVQGSIGGIGLWLIGTPNAFVWTIVMIVFSMLPVLGAGAVLLPTAFVYLLTGSGFEGYAVLGIFGVVSLVDNFLKPRIVGQDMEMNGGFVLLSVVGGLSTFGGIGMIAGPIIFALLVALWHTYHTIPPIDSEEEASEEDNVAPA